MVRPRPSDYLPNAVLGRPEFIEACDRRDLGAVINLVSRWAGPGWTASHIGRRCGLGLSQIAGYRRGQRRATSLEVWERVADGLRIPGQLLHLGKRAWEGEDQPVNRRDFLRAGTTAAAPLSSLPKSDHAARTPVTPAATQVDQLEHEVARLRRLDAHVSGKELYTLYRPVLDDIETALDHTQGVTSRGRLQRLFIEHAQQTGWAAFDAGRQQDACRHYDYSWRLAREIGDRELAANALALRAYQRVSVGHDGTELSARSIAVAERGARSPVLAMLYQRAAWTAATARQPEEAERLLALAEGILDPDADGPSWANWANNMTEQRIMAGRCWTHLQRPLRAVPALEQALTNYSDDLSRDKSLYLSWLAESYIDASEPEQAAATTRRSIYLANTATSVRPRQRIAHVLERLQDHRHLPAVAELLLLHRPLNPT